ncbi:Dihydrolipoamide acetyltransferase component (E2) of acetoin dehydrogenase complex [hydrothermal vent metagenome]|uniref:Dihydrolipoamide acetyltransferase component (E2) of acetoin dehydrogenase complex n=1 Tax=hydrothermal vent metagenome TaxID=652676 RepID=A0A3B0TFR1_9ZZZZ
MTIKAVTVPKWGLSMDEGELVQWNISPGDEVTVGQEIAEIETSKIAGPVEAAVAGKVRRLIAEEGEILPVGALMVVLADDDQSDEDIEAFIAEFEVADQAEDGDENSGPTLSTLSLGDMDISYLEVSPADPAAIPVVLIHGFGGDSNNWLFNQGKIGESHRVIALDLPGHGRSGKNVEDGSIKGLAAVVDRFLAALDIEEAHLFGHSMGAAVALQCAIDGSCQISSLTLICPALVGRGVNPEYISGFRQGRTRKQLKPTLSLLFSDEQLVTRELVDDVLKYKRLDGVADALDIIASTALGSDTPAFDPGEIASLQIPVSVIWGDNDRIICGTEPHMLTGGNVTEHHVENAGHMPHMENAAAVNEILMRNLQG